VTALCAGADQLYATDAALTGPDELDTLTSGGDYGPGGIAPVLEVPAEAGGLGGCAVSGSSVFLGAMDGQQVDVVQLDAHGAPTGDPEPFLAKQYGRLRTVVQAADGALWITTSNRDGVGTPEQDDDRVLRVPPPGGQPDSPL
jgi:glucose/arabinose dehydrogenase